MQRVVARVDSGFAAWAQVDPLLIGDVNGSGAMTATDVGVMTRIAQGGTRLEIPALPSGIGPLTFVGPDPLVKVGTSPSGAPGAVVTVPLTLDTAAGLDTVQARITYDPTQLASAGVRRGDLTADFRWSLVDDRTPGLLVIDLVRATPMVGGTGNLLELDFLILPGATPGSTPIDLQYVALNETRLTLQPEPKVGPDPTDGVVTVVAPPAPAGTEDAQLAATRQGAWVPPAPLVSGVPPTLPPAGPTAPTPAAPTPPAPDWAGQAWAKDLSARLAQIGSDGNPVTPPRGGLLASLSRALLGGARR
jgi:hypothetical protein